MRVSEMLLPTERKARSDAVVTSHQLMIRSGMIRQLTSGVYSYLPIGLRSVRKVSQIVREEMDRAGALEVFLPALQPSDLWRETGRWEQFGPELFRLKDRNDRDFCLGPTHEEVVTDLVRREVRSHRQLALNLYQIQTKFRDEPRPRFGVMRGREFTMKDAYSFDATEEGAERSYWRMYEAYDRIFSRCGLRFRAVEADTGVIGGSFSHEFMVLAESGEDVLVTCTHCDYAANLERAEIRPPENAPPAERPLALKRVATPEMRTVEEVCTFLRINPAKLIKTLIYRFGNEAAAVLVRGDREVNDTKLARALDCPGLQLADDVFIQQVTGAPKGFAGPVDLNRAPDGQRLTIVADHEIRALKDAVTGGNEKDFHLIHVDPPRDFVVDRYGDFRKAEKDDLCPRCSDGRFEIWRGIEVGHVFKLGTKYSEAMGATFQDENGEERPMVMGCYGIGIERTLAAAIEQNSDKDGVVFPMAIAPFQVLVLGIQPEIDEVMEVSESIYRGLRATGVEVLFDDRQARPGIKFKDADLIGIPLRINVGARMLKEDQVELRHRRTGEVEILPRVQVEGRVREIIRDQTERHIG